MEKNKEVSIVIPPIQLQAIYFYYNYAFAIRLPSHTFANRTEGLCGNCNKNKTDDFKTHSGIVTNDTDDFGLSWLVPHVSTMKDCHVPPKENGCIPLPPTEDPCLKLIDLNVFKKCRNVLDPAPYIVACQFDLCHSLDQEKAACRDMEAYARDCERAGVCLDWRSEGLCPYNCPTGLQYKACQSGCRRTCNDLKSDLSSCGLSSTESCVCPDKQVLRGNKCVHESQCEPCDSEDHYDGDFWEVDNCTNCTCVDNTKECKTTDCSSVRTICPYGMYTIEETSSEDKCCKKVTCVQKPSSPTPVTEGPCPTPPVPVCREDQEPVSTVRDDGCQQIVCQCLPCKPLRNEGGVELEVPEVELPEVGLVRVLDSSGCCPHYKWVCDRKKCPTPKKCKQPFVSIEQPVPSDKCCPIYTCVPPPNECMVQMANDSRIMSKELNSVWKESPCTECKCVTNVVGEPEQRCTHMECPPMDEGVNLNVEYIVESLRPPDECCARNFLKACKVNEKVLKPGETSLSRYPDHCKEYRCLEQEDGSVKKDVMIEKCKVNCELGSKYISAESDSAKCCGECRPVGCVAGGKMYKEGTVWHSDDNCTTYFCLSLNGTMQIDAMTTKCLETPIEIHEDYLVDHQELPGECCKKIHYVACIDDGVTYQPGEMWESITDPCKNLTCVQGIHGTLSKSESIQTCTETCSEGWQYIPPPQRSPVCCGRCEQVACIHDGQLHEVDSTWKSENGCIKFTCSKSEMGQYQVIRSEETCPVLNCPPDQVVREGCCDKCNVSVGESHTKFGPCKPENVENTLHLVQKHMSQHDGLCKNTGVIEGFTTCNGSCISSTEYNARTNRQESNCQCCQATRFKLLTVALTCPDDYVFETQVPVPENCECSSCGSHIKNVKSEIAT